MHLRLSSKTHRIRTSFMISIIQTLINTNTITWTGRNHINNRNKRERRNIMRCVTSSSAIASLIMRSTSLLNLSICCFVSFRGLPVGCWAGGADKRREIELGLRRKRSPMAVGHMPSFACQMTAKRFSSADIRGGCGGSLDCFASMLPTPSGCAGVWEGPKCVKLGQRFNQNP